MKSALGYFGEVSALLRGIAVTDRGGRVLGLDEGGDAAAERLRGVGSSGGKVLLIGNGGSSAIVSHMQSDLMKNVGVRALVFHDTPLLTATTNDDGYERAFADPVARWIDAGDVLVAVSSSGRSANILRAVRVAREAGAEVIVLTGFDADNPLRVEGDISFYVDSHEYGLVEGAHTLITHFLTDRAAELSARAQG